MKDLIGKVIAIMVVLGIIVAIGVGAFKVKRWFNWKMGYESVVQQEISKAMTEHVNKYHSGK